jgi:hypothetical protein
MRNGLFVTAHGEFLGFVGPEKVIISWTSPIFRIEDICGKLL